MENFQQLGAAQRWPNLSAQDHQKLVIVGVNVLFPGEPYPSQVDMMTRMLRCINRQNNGLIESPAGSVKTLALLCSVLAWRQHNVNQGGVPRKIFYCTQSHKQLSAVVNELKKTAYGAPWSLARPHIAVLASRENYCLNEDFRASSDPEANCKLLIRNQNRNNRQLGLNLPTCRFYNLDDHDVVATGQQPHEIMDIEDLRKVGTREMACPYFGSLRQYRDADLVIFPYNHLVPAYRRSSLRIHLQDSILVFDDGHALNQALCNDASLSINIDSIEQIVKKCHILVSNHDISVVIRAALNNLIQPFQCLSQRMCQESHEYYSEGIAVIDGIQKSGLGDKELANLRRDFQTVTDGNQAGDGPILDTEAAHLIQKVFNCLEYLYQGNNREHYHIFLSYDVELTLHIICINPNVALSHLARHTSAIIVASSNFPRIHRFSQELGIEFNEVRTVDQPISKDCYWVTKIGISPDGHDLPPLNSENRCIEGVIQAIGDIIVKICEVVPKGVVCFFPSKSFVDTMTEAWKIAGNGEDEMSIIDKIRRAKHIVNERDMTTPERTEELLAEYQKHSREGNGALFFGIHRGKFSEGVIGFCDDEARAVINVSIPYGSCSEPEYVARKALDPNFWPWYQEDAFREVSQTLGQSVRHRNDWGSIILIDPRYFGVSESAILPAWIQDACRSFENFDGMLDNLREFVGRMQYPDDT